jgi:hypothetical protein
MAHGLWSWHVHAARWWIARNPTYSLSAAAMAVGAKLYLCAPEACAGDVGLILLTLGILHAYKLAVAAVLIVLHRLRRSPEDQPSLLLVAALFWTAPLAATLELTQHDRQVGIGFAAAACLVGLVELRSVCRALGLRFSPAGQIAAALCLLLIAAAPARLRVPYGTRGTDELALYGCWWLLGGLVLLALLATHWHVRRRRRESPPERPGRELPVELVFLGIVVVAAATHLYAMNYAFYGNARPFYAVPLLGAVAIVAFELLAIAGIRRRALVGACAALPAIAIALAREGFHPNVPVDDLPAALRDPLATALFIAAAVWWYGARRHRSAKLFHAGSFALALVAMRIFPLPDVPGTGGTMIIRPPFPVAVAIGGHCLTVYLLLSAWVRRSRREALAALVANLFAIAMLALGRADADLMIVLFTVGGSWLAAIHLIAQRPSAFARILPVTLLVTTACYFEREDALCWTARVHVFAMMAALLAVGWVWPWSRYRTIAGLAGLAWLLFVTARGLASGPNAAPALAVALAFLLLTAAATISWHKRQLLALAGPFDGEERRQQSAGRTEASDGGIPPV